ncbi:Aldo-ket-red domain-containing protein [Aphelenchoides besseyi]|nr:Aldo-ket-red domain-containing protein [Aphelenchoides besseyi]
MTSTTVRMSNGVELPLLGLGTSLVKEKLQLEDAIRTAFDVGYRYVDTAPVYGTESAIGDVIEEYVNSGRLKRSDLFICTKLPAHANRPELAAVVFERSLRNLRSDYVDLYLPNNEATSPLLDDEGRIIPEVDFSLLDTWRFMESLYKSGRVRSIGLSNVNSKQLKEIYDAAEIKPHNIQVASIFGERELLDLCHKLDIAVTSYGTLCSPGRSLNKPGVAQVDGIRHPIVEELARAYDRSPAQIVLRFMTQNKISCIPKSVTPERIRQNIQIFDFELSEDDRKKFDSIEPEARLFTYVK